jgi:ABC-type methionine transport system ATPase subunit
MLQAAFTGDAGEGGQRRRVAIARALATDPAVLDSTRPSRRCTCRSMAQILDLLDR